MWQRYVCSDTDFGVCSLMELNLCLCHSGAYADKPGKQKLQKTYRKGEYSLQDHHKEL